MKIRKQVYELNQSDLDRFPVWEFALDEEGEENQDEATVRPWESAGPLDPADGMFVIRAKFILANDTEYFGYITPPVHGDLSISTIQPVIVTDHGQVMFWFGIIPPTSDMIHEAYALLGLKAEDVFPCRYASDVTVKDGPVAGTLNGFMYYPSVRDQRVIEVR